jgi:hypothetical protein
LIVFVEAAISTPRDDANVVSSTVFASGAVESRHAAVATTAMMSAERIKLVIGIIPNLNIGPAEVTGSMLFRVLQ